MAQDSDEFGVAGSASAPAEDAQAPPIAAEPVAPVAYGEDEPQWLETDDGLRYVELEGGGFRDEHGQEYDEQGDPIAAEPAPAPAPVPQVPQAQPVPQPQQQYTQPTAPQGQPGQAPVVPFWQDKAFRQGFRDAMASFDPDAMTEAMMGGMQRAYQAGIEASAALSTPTDPIEAETQRTMARLVAQDPRAAHDPGARTLAELAAVTQQAYQQGQDVWQALEARAAMRRGAAPAQVQPQEAPQAAPQSQRQVIPAAQRMARPSGAPVATQRQATALRGEQRGAAAYFRNLGATDSEIAAYQQAQQEQPVRVGPATGRNGR